RLIGFAHSLVGRLPAGFALVMVVASMMFAAISGSTAATTATIGSVMIPALAKSRGFNLYRAAALQTTAGCIGVIIPPSVPLILMGVVAGISVGDPSLAGVVPGVVMGVTLMIASLLIAIFRGRKKEAAQGEQEDGVESVPGFWRSALQAFLPMMTL